MFPKPPNKDAKHLQHWHIGTVYINIRMNGILTFFYSPALKLLGKVLGFYGTIFTKHSINIFPNLHCFLNMVYAWVNQFKHRSSYSNFI